MLIPTIIFITLLLGNTFSQVNQASSADIRLALDKLNVLGSVLYIAAHPDDENTGVLSYMSKGKKLRTAYLSLTRGGGGQNLLGTEKGALLGVIRTQELLSARRLDGALQYFTRAIDFGYSKTAKETLKNWDRNLILSDIVKVIRKFKPDVILTRFSETRGGHGHHLASAILAKEAFYAAADPKQFADQLKDYPVWQTKRLYWDSFEPFSEQDPPMLSTELADYNPLLGKSYQEIAARARSMHKTQGFGVTANRGGSRLNYYKYTAGDTAFSDLFEDIDLTWNRIPNSQNIQSLIHETMNQFEVTHPEIIVPNLIRIYKAIDKLTPTYWTEVKKEEVKQLIQMCCGIWFESVVWEPGISPGMEITVRSMIVNRSDVPVKIKNFDLTYLHEKVSFDEYLKNNKSFNIKEVVTIPDFVPYSQPYWLENSNDGKMYSIKNEKLNGEAESPPALSAKFSLIFDDLPLDFEIPVVHRWNDAVKGEQIRPFIIQPELSLATEKPTYIFGDNKSQNIHVNLTAHKDSLSGELNLSLPTGWKSIPDKITFALNNKGDKKLFTFDVSPGKNSQSGRLTCIAKINGRTFSQEMIEIKYDHIYPQAVLQPAQAKLVKLDIRVEPRIIGYIMGSGDDIPESLGQLGYEVTLLSENDLENHNLSKYDVIICGVRAFNVRENLESQQKRLINFVENGGTWIVQHNTRFGSQVQQIGPYPFSTSGRDRISEENAPVEILVPGHSVFTYPNIITQNDFNGWVQERGLYFADSWQGKLYPLLASHDNGEPSKLGGLLYAKYGKGVFIYTAYSWFRQLPAGVPGAIRLFVNLISAKGNK